MNLGIENFQYLSLASVAEGLLAVVSEWVLSEEVVLAPLVEGGWVRVGEVEAWPLLVVGLDPVEVLKEEVSIILIF